ncbi:MAG: DUF4198 domain-containing protein [Desulfobacteraceae bacterium]|nr:DUF4198 domain-containing protein [Desulfobacteraceae bacterium]
MTRPCKFFLLSLMICFTMIASVSAHEFVIKPVQMSVQPDQKVPFSVLSCHVFMVSEELEPGDQIDVSLINANTVTPIKLHPNPILLTHDGVAQCKKEGYAIIAGHRKGIIWTQTTQGWKQASKKGLRGVIASGKYEKFCKTLIKAGNADQGFDTIVKDKLEIVPITNPATAGINTEMEFKILYDGKPLSTAVYATYDGFSSNPNTYAYYTECNDQGIAKVKITHPGTWMVRVQKKLDQATEDYDTHIMRAVLVFEVK